MYTPSTTPLTEADLFGGDEIVQWILDRHVIPEQYLVRGCASREKATRLLVSLTGEPHAIVGLRHARNVFTRHSDDCFIAFEEAATPGVDLSDDDADLCSCAAYDSEGLASLIVCNDLEFPAGALDVTWVDAEPVRLDEMHSPASNAN